MKKLFVVSVGIGTVFLIAISGLANSAPTIAISPDTYYSPSEILYVEGVAVPDTTVQLQFKQESAKPLLFSVRSDSHGEWVFAERVTLASGDWEIRVRGSSAESEWSNPRIFKVYVSGVVIGGVTFKFSLLIFFLFISAGVIAYLFLRLKQEIRGKNEAELGEDFSDFRRDITDELKHLQRKRSLSPDEVEHRDKLLHNLEHIEKEINHKLK